MNNQPTLNLYLQQAIVENWNRDAFTDFKGATLQYREVAEAIARLHILFREAGLQHGNKVAVCARNSSNWAVALLATVTYGAVAVPILHDFKVDTIQHLVSHSEARLLFTDKATAEKLKEEELANIEGIIEVHDFSLIFSRNAKLSHADNNLNQLFGQRYPKDFTPADVVFADTAKDEVVLINYTSGSMGFSKGVMLTEENLWSNVQFCIDGLKFLYPGDDMVSMLPLAHMFGLMVEMFHPFVKGCHITFITRTPSPKIILEAFAAVKPKLIVAVPLIIEKVIKTKVFPVIEQPRMKFLLKVPVVNKIILRKIRQQLINAFGGNLKSLIIGGAGVNKEVETFLRKIKFPFTVGYGMTECGPLVAYCPWERQRPGSCGLLVDRMEGRVDSSDPENVPGVLWVRGKNVMTGYYKNPEATDAVMGLDGWMNTGDICTIDRDGYLYIRGRDKNMILGPSGQNIYPEEIEQRLNNMPLVMESLVIDSGNGKLEALIHPDMDAANHQGLSEQQVEQQMKENIKTLNTQLSAYEKISGMRIFPEEFEKTPKRSIKRYLYTKNS